MFRHQDFTLQSTGLWKAFECLVKSLRNLQYIFLQSCISISKIYCQRRDRETISSTSIHSSGCFPAEIIPSCSLWWRLVENSRNQPQDWIKCPSTILSLPFLVKDFSSLNQVILQTIFKKKLWNTQEKENSIPNFCLSLIVNLFSNRKWRNYIYVLSTRYLTTKTVRAPFTSTGDFTRHYKLPQRMRVSWNLLRNWSYFKKERWRDWVYGQTILLFQLWLKTELKMQLMATGR